MNRELLLEIDDLLAHLEDFTHGKDGEEITKIRKKIHAELYSNNNNKNDNCCGNCHDKSE